MPGDAALGTVLKELRQARKLTLATVARRAGCAESQLSYVESGRRHLHRWLAEQLDVIYRTGGVVCSLVQHRERERCDDAEQRTSQDRQLHVHLPRGGAPIPVSRRNLLSGLGIGLLTGRGLAQFERAVNEIPPTEDTLRGLSEAFGNYQVAARSLPPTRLIDAMTGHTAVLDRLRRRSGEALRGQYLTLQARYAESLCWLSEEAGRADDALFWTDRANEWAQGCGWTAMTAYTLVRRSMMAISFANDGHRAVDYARSAFDLPGTPPRIRGLAAKQMAFGHALVWDGESSTRALDQAMTLLAQPTEDGGDLGQRSVVSDDLYSIFRTTCDIYLGKGEAAISLLEPRLTVLSAASARTATITRAKLAHAYANVGQPREAVQFARQSLADSTAIESLSARAELRRTVPVLQQWHGHADVADVLHRLRGGDVTSA